MKKSQIEAIWNKADSMGLLDYLVFCTDCEAENIIHVKSDTQSVYMDSANDCLIVLETNADPLRMTFNDKPLIISYVDYDHIVKADIYLDGKEFRENKDKFEFDNDVATPIVNAVANNFRATGYLRDKETGKLPKVPGMAVDFELGVPVEPYIPPKKEEEAPEEEPVETPTEDTQS